jgi:hypothetical protein
MPAFKGKEPRALATEVKKGHSLSRAPQDKILSAYKMSMETCTPGCAGLQT